ncbi:MAG: helix-turn-helix transcriptional regulator [Bacteroidales bacterium]|nr:helix-turn-helix transcriptional regulator [Bacteroidales bacterium]
MIKDRIRQIIELENLTHSDFAKALGVQRSNISHILAGRNNPSIDFIHKLLLRFKNINADWLIMGEGSMYKNPPNTLFDMNSNEHKEEIRNADNDKTENSIQNSNYSDDKSKNVETSTHSTKSQPVSTTLISPNQILVLFDDETFITYKKRT